jgi:hypothetical protein
LYIYFINKMEYPVFSFDNIKYRCQQDLNKLTNEFTNNEFDDAYLICLDSLLTKSDIDKQLAKISNETYGELRKIYLSYQMMTIAATFMLDKKWQTSEEDCVWILELQDIMKEFKIEIFGNMSDTNIGVMTHPTLNFIYTIVENSFMTVVWLLALKHILIPFFTGKPY